jgi:hypothetical protein
MISLGADSLTIIPGRFILSYITCTIIVFATRNMKEGLFLKLFFREDKQK